MRSLRRPFIKFSVRSQLPRRRILLESTINIIICQLYCAARKTHGVAGGRGQPELAGAASAAEAGGQVQPLGDHAQPGPEVGIPEVRVQPMRMQCAMHGRLWKSGCGVPAYQWCACSAPCRPCVDGNTHVGDAARQTSMGAPDIAAVVHRHTSDGSRPPPKIRPTTEVHCNTSVKERSLSALMRTGSSALVPFPHLPGFRQIESVCGPFVWPCRPQGMHAHACALSSLWLPSSLLDFFRPDSPLYVLLVLPGVCGS